MIGNTINNITGYSSELNSHREITGAHISAKSVSSDNPDKVSSLDHVDLSFFKIEESVTYSSTGTLQSTLDASYDLLRGYVLDVFEKQGMDFTLSTGDETVDLSELSQSEAQELIAENGYFGVDQTSDRIVEFAVGIAGNDPSRLDAILQGVEQGFNEALEAFGSWLPEISYKTYDTAVDKIHKWAEG